MPAPDPFAESQARVYRKQGATAQVIASGGTLEVQPGGVIDVSSGSIVLPANLKRGFQPLNIFAGRIMASGENFFDIIVNTTGASLNASVGGILHAGSVPALQTGSTVARGAQISWASGQAQVVAFPPIPIPPDFASAGGLVIHALAERASDNASNNVLDFRFWANQNASNKGTTGSTMTSTPADYSAVVSSAEAGGYPGTWQVHIVPGTHTNNAVRLFGAWIEYDRKTS